MLKCGCEEWEKFIDVVCEWALAYQLKFRYREDDFKQFKYCPWCGKELVEGIEHGIEFIR